MSAMRGEPESPSLTPRQKLALTYKKLTPEAAIAMEDAHFDGAFFLEHDISSELIRAAKLTPLALKQRGLESAFDLKRLGFDALDLVDASFCASSVAAFGSDDVLAAFLGAPGDAVCLAGSPAVVQLGVTVESLLSTCAGAPAEAKAVLLQCKPRAQALVGVDIGVLLDTGLRKASLVELGYTEKLLTEQCGATRDHLLTLGF